MAKKLKNPEFSVSARLCLHSILIVWSLGCGRGEAGSSEPTNGSTSDNTEQSDSGVPGDSQPLPSGTPPGGDSIEGNDFPMFTWLRDETFSIGGQTRTVSIYRNEVFAAALDLGTSESALDVEFVHVPGGSFSMGSSDDERAIMVESGAVESRLEDERPQHVVDVPSFFVARVEVTQRLWRAFADRAALPPEPSFFARAGETAPVETVSWEQARQWLASINRNHGSTLRLPSESEWEYAARSGSDTTLYNGDMVPLGQANAPELDPIAWYMGNSGVDYTGAIDSSRWPEKQIDHQNAGVLPVGEKRPNAFGLFDMLGNVMEWCEDEAHANYIGAPNDGSTWIGGDTISGNIENGPAAQVPERCAVVETPDVPGRMRRGGSYRNFAYNTRNAIRSLRGPRFCDSNQGFRIAASLLEELR